MTRWKESKPSLSLSNDLERDGEILWKEKQHNFLEIHPLMHYCHLVAVISTCKQPRTSFPFYVSKIFWYFNNDFNLDTSVLWFIMSSCSENICPSVTGNFLKLFLWYFSPHHFCIFGIPIIWILDLLNWSFHSHLFSSIFPPLYLFCTSFWEVMILAPPKYPQINLLV